jgi:hypothetical protein
MKDEQLKRLMNLTRVTGDRLVVADNETGENFVLMNLDEYEELCGVGGYESSVLGADDSLEEIKIDEVPDVAAGVQTEKNISTLSEEEMLAKINRDIADWRAAQKKKDEEVYAEEITDEAKAETAIEVGENDEQETEKKEIFKFPSGMTALGSVLTDEKYRKREFDDVPRVNPLEEEDLADVPHVEEKFYLEPVE